MEAKIRRLDILSKIELGTGVLLMIIGGLGMASEITRPFATPMILYGFVSFTQSYRNERQVEELLIAHENK